MLQPDQDEMAALLKERYGISGKLSCVLSSAGGRPTATIAIERRNRTGGVLERFEIEIKHQRGGTDPWELLIDAADAMVGTLVEAGYDHRSLPRGEDLEFEEARFSVEVAKSRPEIDAEADRLLGD